MRVAVRYQDPAGTITAFQISQLCQLICIHMVTNLLLPEFLSFRPRSRMHTQHKAIQERVFIAVGKSVARRRYAQYSPSLNGHAFIDAIHRQLHDFTPAQQRRLVFLWRYAAQTLFTVDEYWRPSCLARYVQPSKALSHIQADNVVMLNTLARF